MVLRAGVAGRNRPAEEGRGGPERAAGGRKPPPHNEVSVCGRLGSSAWKLLQDVPFRALQAIANPQTMPDDGVGTGTHCPGVWKPLTKL
jgi:hypothetical protein